MADRELLLERLERLAIVLDELMPQCAELVRDAIDLLKEQQRIIEQYQKADGFLFAHGWKWENYIDTREEPHPIEVGEDGLPY